ncbi:hypothetical protein ACOMHN_005597 [Nucella lapillus]
MSGYRHPWRHHPDFLYIGSPVNLRHRWANHKPDCKLRKGHKCHVAQHFLDKQHPVDPQCTCLRIFAIEAVHKENLDFLYIGSSVNLRHRWANHKSDCKLRKGHKCHVAQHFLDKQHPVDPQCTCLRIFAIEAMHKKENLGKRETWWQVNVGTIFLGLNMRSDISALVRNRSRVQY